MSGKSGRVGPMASAIPMGSDSLIYAAGVIRRLGSVMAFPLRLCGPPVVSKAQSMDVFLNGRDGYSVAESGTKTPIRIFWGSEYFHHFIHR